jgi:hypothetical protein
VRFEKEVHNFGPGVQIAYVQDGQPQTAWFLKDVPRLRERTILGTTVRLEEIKDEFIVYSFIAPNFEAYKGIIPTLEESGLKPKLLKVESLYQKVHLLFVVNVIIIIVNLRWLLA